ncbi:hypothetical protein L9F63_006368, partial [Diploptera punctata]
AAFYCPISRSSGLFWDKRRLEFSQTVPASSMNIQDNVYIPRNKSCNLLINLLV